jgi:hypothetical protein
VSYTHYRLPFSSIPFFFSVMNPEYFISDPDPRLNKQLKRLCRKIFHEKCSCV